MLTPCLNAVDATDKAMLSFFTKTSAHKALTSMS